MSSGKPSERAFSLSEFLGSTAGIAKGQKVTRRDIIKYISNVKGGVHLGGSQHEAEKTLIARLEKFERKIIMHNSDGILIELVAIAQAVAGSNDAQKLISAIEKL